MSLEMDGTLDFDSLTAKGSESLYLECPRSKLTTFRILPLSNALSFYVTKTRRTRHKIVERPKSEICQNLAMFKDLNDKLLVGSK